MTLRTQVKTSTFILITLMICASACRSKATVVFSVPGASPSFDGSVAFEKSIISVQEAGRVIRVDVTGREIWRAELEGPLTERAGIIGNILAIPSSSGMWFGLDASTGDVLWKKDNAPPPAFPVQADDSNFYIMAFDGKVHALEALTGKEKWAYTLAGSPSEEALMCVNDGVVIAWRGRGLVVAIDTQSGAALWKRKGHPRSCSGDEKNLILHHHDGRLEAFNIHSQAAVWERRIGAPAPQTTSTDSADHSLWLGQADGMVLGIKAATGVTFRQFSMPGALAAPISFGRKMTFAPISGREGCLWFGTTHVTFDWASLGTKICVNHELRGQPILIDDVLFVTPRDGRVIGYRIKEITQAIKSEQPRS